MAFGRHWEWRGFGALSPEMRAGLEALPLKFPRAQKVIDKYLWIPEAAINVKLRMSCFKLKRCLETRGDFQLWLEDPDENYSFPLDAGIVATVARELGVRIPELERPSYDRGELLELLARGEPSVRVIAVHKRRWQREWGGDARKSDSAVTIEVADILEPEATTSVGVEHPTLVGVQRACTALRLEGALRAASYLEALGRWAVGASAARP